MDMVRPAGNTDQQLIQAALQLLPRTGFANLKVRAVAQHAGVNLGMFHYHFKNKKQFIERLLKDVYESFFSQLQLEAAAHPDPVLRLRVMIKIMVCFVRDHRQLAIPLLNDLMQQQPEVQAFFVRNVQRHLKLLLMTIRAAQRAGRLVQAPLPVLIPFIFGSQVAPHVIASVVAGVRVPLPAEVIKFLTVPKLISDQAIEQRLDLVMRAITLPGPHQDKEA